MNKDVLNLLKDRYFADGEKKRKDISNRISTIYPPIKEYVNRMDIIPSSPTLMNWNCERNGTLSSCFPMEIGDSIEDIFSSLADSAKVTKYSGGVGFDFSSLRSSSEGVKGIGDRMSSGPLPFIKIFNSMLDGVSQGGSRRGAGMSMLNIDHPNILDFIDAKKDFANNPYNRFNFSIRIPNWFYDKLEKSPDDIMMIKNVIDDNKRELIDNKGERITIKNLWDKIIGMAWFSAEPGIFNSDIAYDRCTVTNVNRHVLSNPCSEYVNIPNTGCSLASINISNFVKNGKFDWKGFIELVHIATIFLDNTIDVNNFPIEKISKVNEKVRPIGLGYMGIAHALMLMGIPYNSKDGYSFIKKISRTMTLESMKESIAIAKKKGAYPAFDYDLYIRANDRFFQTEEEKEILKDLKKYGVRNSCQTSIAPTGSISFIAQTSSGIEPVFSLGYTRKIEIGKNDDDSIKYEEVFVFDPVFEKYIKKKYPQNFKDIFDDVSKNNGSCQKCKIISADERSIFVTAQDISAEDHLESLSMAANNTSLSVSKTINLPRDAKQEEIAKVYTDAYKKGIIGVTVYRDGSREGVLVTNVDDKKDKIVKTVAPKRPKELKAEMHHITLKRKRYYVAIGLFQDDVYEIYTGENYDNDGEVYIPSKIKEGRIIKKSSGTYIFKNGDDVEYYLRGYHNEDTAEALTRQISLSLRHGTSINFIVEQLQKIKVGDMTSYSRVLARTLKKYIPENTESSEKCPNCGSNMRYESGCVTCPQCGNSKCG